MRIVAKYSFNDGEKVVQSEYANLLREVEDAINSVNCRKCKTKKSTEKNMPGKLLYSPVALNAAFKKCLFGKGWRNHKVKCEYSDEYYIEGYKPVHTKGSFREMDFVKERFGVEIQFGKYAFVDNYGCAKMTIFKNLGYIDFGVEIVPVKALAAEMSSGVSYFEQFVWDLDHRGTSNIDISVLILGIDV